MFVFLFPACRGARAAVGSEVGTGGQCLHQLLVGEIRGVCGTQRGPWSPDQGYWGQQTWWSKKRFTIKDVFCAHVKWSKDQWLSAALHLGYVCFFQAEAAFMVARGMVREAHISLEALQVRLKEVRDRLDRVSREEAHYLELATQEHKLLQVGSHSWHICVKAVTIIQEAVCLRSD